MRQSTDRYERLRALLGEVARDRPFYRERYAAAGVRVDEGFLDGVQDRFGELPILETEDILANADAIGIERPRVFRVTCSGGTVDEPKVLYRTAEDWTQSSANVAEIFAITGLGRGDVLLIAQPLRIWGIGYLALDACRWLECMAVPVGIEEESGRLAYFMERFGVTAVFTSPSLWKRFTDWAQQRHLRSPVRVLCAGEKLYEADRECLASYWRQGVYNIYGSEETDGLGAECAQRQGLHLLEHSYLFEVERNGVCVDVSGPGIYEGDLIVTSLYHRGTPLIRYRLGDIVRLERREAACGCGRRGPLLTVIGKSKQCVTLFDATKVYVYQVDAALERVLGRDIQSQLLVEDGGRTAVERMTVLLPAEALAGRDARELLSHLARASVDLEDSVRRGQVELMVGAFGESTATTRKGKWQKIIDRRMAPQA